MRKALATAAAGLAITGFGISIPTVAQARTSDAPPQYVVSSDAAGDTPASKTVFAICNGSGDVPTDDLTGNDTAVDYNLAANAFGNASLAKQPSPIKDGIGRTVGWQATFTQAGPSIVVTCEDDQPGATVPLT